MGQSIGSTGGGGRKQSGADSQQKDQPSTNPGQRLSDQQGPVPKKGKPEGGADHGPRSGR